MLEAILQPLLAFLGIGLTPFLILTLIIILIVKD